MSKLEDENKTNSFCEYLASLSDEKLKNKEKGLLDFLQPRAY